MRPWNDAWWVHLTSFTLYNARYWLGSSFHLSVMPMLDGVERRQYFMEWRARWINQPLHHLHSPVARSACSCAGDANAHHPVVRRRAEQLLQQQSSRRWLGRNRSFRQTWSIFCRWASSSVCPRCRVGASCCIARPGRALDALEPVASGADAAPVGVVALPASRPADLRRVARFRCLAP